MNVPIKLIMRKVNSIVYGWSNYFLPSPNQYALRRSLDQYVFKRSLKWLHNKYSNKGFGEAVRTYMMHKDEEGRLLWNKSLTIISKARKQKYSLLRLRDFTAPSPTMFFKPSNELSNYSFIVNPSPYIKL